MSYPKTKDEWWAMLTEEKTKLRDLVVDFHPRSRVYDNAHDMEITAPGAEAICDAVRRHLTKGGPIDAGAAFDAFLDTKDAENMSGMLSATWFGLPESVEVRSLPGFGLLCDLCSEADVLYEDGEVPE